MSNEFKEIILANSVAVCVFGALSCLLFIVVFELQLRTYDTPRHEKITYRIGQVMSSLAIVFCIYWLYTHTMHSYLKLEE